MTFYDLLAARVGSPEARALADDLNSWHDEMVLHRRRVGHSSSEPCSPECPCRHAPFYWNEARRVFGESAIELSFLRASAARGRAKRAQPGAGRNAAPSSP